MDKDLENLVKILAEKLKQHQWSLVTAESCTGGGLAYFISLLPGCSSILERGYVVYSEEAKQELLGVKKSTIDIYGAVSPEVAKGMAEGALMRSHAQASISITGLAGPNGDQTSDKPIGTVCIGCAAIHQKTAVITQQFSGDRHAVCRQSINVALRAMIDFIAV